MRMRLEPVGCGRFREGYLLATEVAAAGVSENIQRFVCVQDGLGLVRRESVRERLEQGQRRPKLTRYQDNSEGIAAGEVHQYALTEHDVHREYGYLAMEDGTRLAYVVWRAKEKGEYPTIVNYSAYGQSATPFAEAKRFLEAGYAYVGVNVRGTGSSEGTFSYYQEIEGPDGAEIIAWAAAQRWSTGDIGMVGASYGGHTQIKVAALRPPHLRAIVPLATEGSEYRDEAMPGGIFNAGLMAHWTFGEQPNRARVGTDTRIREGDAECAAIRAIQSPNRSYGEVLQHPLYDDWWRARALDTIASQVMVPTLLIHGWQDEWIRPNGAIRLFKLLKSRHKKLLLQNGPHRLTPYEINQREQMRWLNRWVKGERNNVEMELPITVLWEVTEPEVSTRAAPGWITTYPTWPVPNVEWSTLYLTAGGELSPEKPSTAENQGMRSYVYPLGTELVGSNEQFNLAPLPLGTLNYRTAPMISDTVLLGSPQLIFYFSSDQVDTDFMFTLKDIDPSRNTLFLQRTVLRASLRAVDEGLSSQDEVIQAFTRMEKLVPDKVYEVMLSLSAFGHVLRKGHRLEFSILAPNSVPNPIWGFASTLESSVNNIYHSELYPSKLQLPVVRGEKALRPAPSLGTLRNQPFR